MLVSERVSLALCLLERALVWCRGALVVVAIKALLSPHPVPHETRSSELAHTIILARTCSTFTPAHPRYLKTKRSGYDVGSKNEYVADCYQSEYQWTFQPSIYMSRDIWSECDGVPQERRICIRSQLMNYSGSLHYV
jgi:hypothetical protein